MSKQEDIKYLESAILHHKQRYYLGDAEISDAEYDALEERLRQLAPDSYVLQVVGYHVTQDKVAHDTPMLSLEKRRSIRDVVAWMEGETCTVTDKMDGSSASFVYRNGVLSLAKSIVDGLNRFGWKTLEALQARNVVIIPAQTTPAGQLQGCTFVITGSLSRPRRQIQFAIEQAGGKVVGVSVPTQRTWSATTHPRLASIRRRKN